MKELLIIAFLVLWKSFLISGFINFNNIYTKSNILQSSTSDDDVVYGGYNHCGIIVKDTEKAKDFFIKVFGFTDETELRPNTLPYPGAFLRIGAHQLHLMELPNPDSDTVRPEYVGRDKHLAISVNSIKNLAKRLDGYDWKYKLSSSGRQALFCRDIDNNGFEFVEVHTN